MNKKRWTILAIFLMLLLVLPVIVADQTQVQADQKINIVIDGKTVVFPDQQPYFKDGRTMVPVRAPMEAMGCTVSWDAAKMQAIIVKGDTKAVFTIGSKTYTVNGQTKTMDVAPEIAGDRTSFPLRYAVEAMGASVGWDASTTTVSISTTGQITTTPTTPTTTKPVIGSKYEKLDASEVARLKALTLAKESDAGEPMGSPVVYTTPDKQPTYETMLDKLVIKSNQTLYSDRSLIFKNGVGLYEFFAVLVTYNSDGTISDKRDVGIFASYSSKGWHEPGIQDINTWEILN